MGGPASAGLYPRAAAQPGRCVPGRPGRGGPAAGTVYQEVRLTNGSGLPCTLSAGPSAVTGVRSDGSLVTLTRVAYGDGANLVGPGPANLRPGQSGWVTLAYADACQALTSGGRAGYRTLFIAAGRGQVRIDFPAALSLVCGLLASTFGAPAAPSPAATSPLNVLAAAVRLPAALTAGTTASYSVTLHNTSGTRLVLVPCPSLHPVPGDRRGPRTDRGRPAALLPQLRRRPADPGAQFRRVRDAHRGACCPGAGEIRLAAGPIDHARRIAVSKILIMRC